MASATLSLDPLSSEGDGSSNLTDLPQITSSLTGQPTGISEGDAQSIGVTASFDAAQWLISALRSINRLASLPPNWSSYSSRTISPNALADARLLLSSIRADGIPEPFIAPVSGGGVTIEWSHGQQELEVEILPDGSVEVLRVHGGQQGTRDDAKEIRVSRSEDVPMNRLVEWVFSD